jgi:heme A synthase
MWPAFVALIAVDAVIGHLLPPVGEKQSIVAAALGGLVLNLIAVILLSWPLGVLLRRRRPDLPMTVARDYAGTAVVLLVTAGLLGAGLAHRSSITSEQQTMRDAVVRAQAFIGDRAPDQFRRNVKLIDTVTIQPGSIYRMCVPGAHGVRTYCVIVDTQLPFARSVKFAGYEPNSSVAAGTG